MFNLLIISIFYINSKGKVQIIVSYSINILSVYGVLIQTVLTIPFFTSFFTAIYCNNDSPLS